MGIQVGAPVFDTHHAAFPERFYRSDALHPLVSLGVIFDRNKHKKITGISAGAKALIGSGPGYTVQELRDRVHEGLADEIWPLLEENVVESAEGVDVAMLLGAGLPFHRGEVKPYVDGTGSSEKVRGTTVQAPVNRGVD